MFKDLTKFNKIWLIISILIATIAFSMDRNIIAYTTTILGLLYVLYVANGNPKCYPFAIIQLTLYVFIAWNSKIYGDFWFNTLYTIPMNVYGFILWRKNKDVEKENTIVVRTLPLKKLALIFTAWAICIILLAQILTLLGGNTVYLDATTTTSVVFAMLLSVNRYKESWYFWIIVNSVSVTMWGIAAIVRNDGNGILMGIMYLCYFVNSLYGLHTWNKLNKNNK